MELCKDAVSRHAIISTLNTMDRYTADELTLCDTNQKFPRNEVFIVDDVYEEIAEGLPCVIQKAETHWIPNTPENVPKDPLRKQIQLANGWIITGWFDG